MIRRKAGMLAALLFLNILICRAPVQAAEEIAINAVNFPDENFREYLEQFDDDRNGFLSAAERGVVSTIDVQGKGIRSVKGVEFFRDLRNLSCENNAIPVINVSANTRLEYLDCSGNNLAVLDVRNNRSLTSLYCHDNRITGLDLRENTALNMLNCSRNLLKELNLVQNTQLSSVICDGNRLRVLDLSSCRKLENISCASNRLCSLDLTGLAGTDISLSADKNRCYIGTPANGKYNLSALSAYGFNRENAYFWAGASEKKNELSEITSDQITYSYSCGKGHSVTFTLTLGGAALSEDIFPDAVFREILEAYDTDNDGALSVNECRSVLSLELSERGISDLKGIEYLTELKRLYCNGNQLTQLDLSQNGELLELWCNDNQLKVLNVSGCMKLVQLYVHNNQLSGLLVTGCPALEELNCGDNQLTSLDLSQNTALRRLTCAGNILEALFLEKCPHLVYLNCADNYLTSLHLDACTLLEEDNLLAEGNRYNIGEVDPDGYNLEALHKNGFSELRAYNWTGAECDVSLLKGLTVGTITYSYDCGNRIVRTFQLAVSGIAHAHVYKSTVKAPTCTVSGYTIYTCEVCGDTYMADYVEPLGHQYKTEITKATTKKNGTATVCCSLCGAVKSQSIIHSAKSLKLSRTSYVYNGAAKKPGVTVKDSGGAVISSAYYTVSYSNHVKAGTARVKVLFRGNYSGSLTADYTIYPPATKVVKKAAVSKGFRLYWVKEPRQISGYQIIYSTDSSFASRKTKSVTIPTIGATHRTVMGLSAQKTYYIRIRTYVKTGNRTLYSSWSKSVKVKTKK